MNALINETGGIAATERVIGINASEVRREFPLIISLARIDDIPLETKRAREKRSRGWRC